MWLLCACGFILWLVSAHGRTAEVSRTSSSTYHMRTWWTISFVHVTCMWRAGVPPNKLGTCSTKCYVQVLCESEAWACYVTDMWLGIICKGALLAGHCEQTRAPLAMSHKLRLWSRRVEAQDWCALYIYAFICMLGMLYACGMHHKRMLYALYMRFISGL